jgi:hypothetical protein
MMRVVYLGAPYSYSHPDPEEQKRVKRERIRQFSLAFEKLTREGHCVISPLLCLLVEPHTTLPDDWAYWQDYSRTLLERSDEFVILTLDGWQESVGIKGEIEHAEKIGLPWRLL